MSVSCSALSAIFGDISQLGSSVASDMTMSGELSFEGVTVRARFLGVLCGSLVASAARFELVRASSCLLAASRAAALELPALGCSVCEFNRLTEFPGMCTFLDEGDKGGCRSGDNVVFLEDLVSRSICSDSAA